MAEAAVDLAPNQSEITIPSKPHSPRSTVSSIHRFSAAYVPFTRL